MPQPPSGCWSRHCAGAGDGVERSADAPSPRGSGRGWGGSSHAFAAMPNDRRFRSSGYTGMLRGNADPAPQLEADRTPEPCSADLVEPQTQRARMHRLCVILDARRKGQHVPAADHLDVDDQCETMAGVAAERPAEDIADGDGVAPIRGGLGAVQGGALVDHTILLRSGNDPLPLPPSLRPGLRWRRVT